MGSCLEIARENRLKTTKSLAKKRGEGGRAERIHIKSMNKWIRSLELPERNR